MAATTGQRLIQQTSHPAAALAAAATAVVLACAVGLAVFISQAPARTSGGEAQSISQVHATGRGLLAGTGSYATSTVVAASQASGYATGKGGLMENPGLDLAVAVAPALSWQRGGMSETADVR
jgi:hypothetical protein